MKKKFERLFAVFVALIFVVTMSTGCAKSKATAGGAETANQSSTQSVIVSALTAENNVEQS